MDIAQTLKEFRQENELEQGDLARLLETTQQTVSNWESGTVPRAGALKRINHLLATYKKGQAPTPYTPAPPGDRSRYPTFASTMIPKEELAHQYVQPYTAQVNGRPQIVDMDQFESRMFAALPQDIAYQRGVSVSFQRLRLRVDYVSAKVCAEIKLSGRPGASPFLDLGIHHLNTVRHIHARNNELRETYALVLVTPDINSAYPYLNRLLSLAALHEIAVLVVTTPEEGAHLLTQLEFGKLDDEEQALDY